MQTVPFPGHIQIETFHGCNARCRMCPIHDSQRRRGPMADALFADIVAELADHRDVMRIVSLYSEGEPLMDKKLEQRIALCKAEDLPNVGFSTNASLLTPDRMRTLMDAGTDWIAISFHSLTKAIYEDTRRNLIFEEVRQNILDAVAARDAAGADTRISMRFHAAGDNDHEEEAYVALFTDLLTGGKDEIRILEVHDWGGQVNHDGDTPPGERARACPFPFTRMVIFNDGQVPLCCLDYKADHPMGDISGSSIAEVWGGPAFEEVRRQHRNLRIEPGLELCMGCETAFLGDKRIAF